MKRSVAIGALVVVAACAFLVYRYAVLDAPERAAGRIDEIRAQNPQLEQKVTEYVDAMRVIGVPFQRAATVESHLARIAEARATTVSVDGTLMRPWEEIARHAAGAEILDGALEATSDVVGSGGDVERRAAEVREAAVAYMVAREALSHQATAQTVDMLCRAARALAVRLDALAEAIAPLATATAAASAALDGAVAWLADVTPDGDPQREVLGSVAATTRTLAGAVQVPERHFEESAQSIADDAAALREIADVARTLRRPLF